MGRIFAYGAITYFGQGFENYRSSANFLAIFFHGPSYVFINCDEKKLLGYILGDFFINATGHPGWK
jgi:hypothetical protein